MKKLLLLSLFMLTGFGWAQAQTQVKVTIENQRIVGDDFYFDVMLADTTGSPFFLGYADIVLTNILPAGAFNSPTIAYVANSTTLLNEDGTTATGYNSSTVNPALGSGANANRILINVDFPAFSNQAQFEDRVARVDGTIRRLGTFMVSANSKNAFVPNHEFHTSGVGIKTKIYEAAATTPWNQTRIISANAFLLTSSDVLATAPAAYPANFPTNFSESILSSTSISLSWTNGTHDGVILLYRRSNTLTNDTINNLGADTTVANTLAYTANSDWAVASVTDTHKVGTSPYAVAYVGSGTTVTLTNLEAGVQYKYILIPYNGVPGFSVAYASPALMAANADDLSIDRPSVVLAPTWNMAGVYMFNTPSGSSTSMDVKWFINNFANIATTDTAWNADTDSILFVAIGAASANIVAPALTSSYYPTVGKSYNINAAYASGDTLGAVPTAFAVARAQANADSGTITFEGLTAETSYRIYAIPMRGGATANAANYNFTGTIPQDVRFTTPTPVTAPDAGDLVASFNGNPAGSDTLKFTWTLPTNSGYTGVIILAREFAATNFIPVNGVVYDADLNFYDAPDSNGNRIVYSGSGTSANVFGLNPNQRYHFTAIPYKGTVADSNLAYTSDGPTNLWSRSDRHTWMTVSLRANLQGAWAGTANATGLNIPASHPYDSTDFFNYNGNEQYVAANVPNAVDWVLVELRRVELGQPVDSAYLAKVPGSGPSVNIGRRVGLLLADGSIVDTANNGNMLFQITQEGKYYAVVYHRNHIPIMMATGVDTGKNILATGVGNMTVPANVLGTSTTNFIVDGGVAFMAAGNADKSNFVIDGSDRTNIWAARNQSNPNLYILEDVKFDGDDLGEVDATDRAVVWNNRDKAAAAVVTTVSIP
jgi:hypothetical protein